MRNKFLWASVVWTIFVTYYCLASPSEIPKISWLHIAHKDKIAHFIFYFVFTVLWHLYIRSKNTASFRKTILLPFFAAVVYGGFIEICQGLLTTNRSADIMDALTNTAGSAIAVLTLWLKQKNKR